MSVCMQLLVDTSLQKDGPTIVVMSDPIFAIPRNIPRGLEEVPENLYRVEVGDAAGAAGSRLVEG